jgi:hypothetical protein
LSVIRRPYLLSSHVSSLVTSQHFNVCSRVWYYLTSSSVRRLSSVPIEFPRHRSKIWHRSVTAKIEYCMTLILRTCLYLKSILHEIVTV